MSMTDREKACRVISIISSEERERRSGCVDELKLERVFVRRQQFSLFKLKNVPALLLTESERSRERGFELLMEFMKFLVLQTATHP